MTPSQPHFQAAGVCLLFVAVVLGLWLVATSVFGQESVAPRIGAFTTVEGPLEVGPPPDQYRPLAIQSDACKCGVCECERCDCSQPKPEKLPVLSKAPVARTRPAAARCYGGRCYAPQRRRFLFWRW